MIDKSEWIPLPDGDNNRPGYTVPEEKPENNFSRPLPAEKPVRKAINLVEKRIDDFLDKVIGGHES